MSIPFVIIFFKIDGHAFVWDHTVSINSPDYERVQDFDSAAQVVADRLKTAVDQIEIVRLSRSENGEQ